MALTILVILLFLVGGYCISHEQIRGQAILLILLMISVILLFNLKIQFWGTVVGISTGIGFLFGSYLKRN